MKAVCVYCASGPVDEEYLVLAARTGEAIAKAGFTLVSGGGNVSMMGSVARAAREAGGRTIGIIPEHLMAREVADLDSDELIVTDTMRERKRLMDEMSDAFITLPGGIGTFEEFFETWTGGFLGEHDKPVVLLNHEGFYDPLLTWLDDLRARGFVAQRSLDKLKVCETLGDSIVYLTNR
ncbi:TIGR00730 family Rossman fold protein [Gordonia sp. (in: high G+C Gram-positive bacteria)]|uniref:LOG family protein n=1 Tax=Gordonia sp. (in: high G+C Gram-positive bacteria) TaxID=84139 RepID=UPI0016A3C2BB|nr:TIGR00730 family Rossman fold protein [Gordonia sp. (in: high G+C Gram-positive bacteria)]NLG44860.1 TIGR00730 family Rossman fold protein [Gordonia sp. (in: high G+C Gram-positive bacteria)]